MYMYIYSTINDFLLLTFLFVSFNHASRNMAFHKHSEYTAWQNIKKQFYLYTLNTFAEES